MKEGDWVCAACANVNFARRDACNRCDAKRAYQQGGGKGGCGGRVYGDNGYGGGGYEPVVGKGGGRGGAEHGFGALQQAAAAMVQAIGGGGNMKDGDWMCSRCNNHNFASRVQCNKCQTQRPGTKKGDWICKVRDCRNLNFASRDECFKCKEPKPLAA